MNTSPNPGDAMPPRYDHGDVERRWYEQWESSGYFRPDPNSNAPSFVITIPPPNVTGDLHIGHALTYGIEDILGRFKRLQGFNTLIVPGMDHAGIATQNVVEKQLAVEGINRHELGRTAFLERVWLWKEQYAANIRHQFRSLGCSFDWSRERFTMDRGYADAVLEFFIRLYEEKQIYRGWRVINWCVRCHSAISDIEVDDLSREDPLYYLRYQIEGEMESITVATVRPETILGDTAVAVHPEDERYRHLIGKYAILPLLGRRLQIVGDPFVDREFGTGAVKITPAHDFADFEVAERHHLDMPIAISPEATITAVGGPYEGLSVSEARDAILRDLEAAGQLEEIEQYQHNVPICERCGTLLEPLLSEQWFMRMQELAGPAIEAVRDGRVRFVPDRWAAVYLDWMENIRPWTLSRQLWWGHRIPIFYCVNGHATAAKALPERCSVCDGPIDRQDPDVLDTWFSSALWPFAVLGWPENAEDLQQYYPTSFMNTSSQILYLWIARMVMTGLKFRGEVPFPAVLINPTILNKHGQRMSKSLGTGVDPLDLVQEYGADALRFGLMTSGSTHQQDVRFSAERIEQARNFANKLWNIARFIVGNQVSEEDQPLDLVPVDRWILSRVSAVIDSVTADLERYEFSGAGHQIHDFVWSEVADWYVEMAKTRLYDDNHPRARHTARAVLWSVLDQVIRLLHPFMPFVTEEIWQHLRQTGSSGARMLSGWNGELPASIMVSTWPAPKLHDREAERELETVINLIRSIRTVRAEYRVDPGAYMSATVAAGAEAPMFERGLDTIARLARLRPLHVVQAVDDTPSGTVSILVGATTVYLALGELIDLNAERERLGRELEGTEKAHIGIATKLNNRNFVDRAPAEIVARERERAATLLEKAHRLRDQLSALGA